MEKFSLSPIKPIYIANCCEGMKRQRSVHHASCPMASQERTEMFHSEIFADLQDTDTR